MQLNHKAQLYLAELISLLLLSASETLVPRNDLQTDMNQCTNIYHTQHLHRQMVVPECCGYAN
jgi:hypothetical protein